MMRMFVLIAFLPFATMAQIDQVMIRWKNLAPFPGSEVRFFAGVLAKSEPPSTTLYMQLYSDSGGAPIHKWRWRVDNGCAGGKFLAPEKPGFYWVRAYTLGSDSVVFSLRVRPRNPMYTFRRFPDTLSTQFLKHQAVWLSYDAGGYYLLRTDPRILYFGVDVRDTGSFSAPQSWTVQRSAGGYRRDTNYLGKRFKAMAKNPPGQAEIVYSVSGDSNNSKPDVRTLDTAGILSFTGLRLEDSSYIFYMRNRSQEEIALKELPEMDTVPHFSIPIGYVTDTINRDPTPIPGEKGARVLDTVYKKLRYDQRNIVLHNLYVKGHLNLEAGIDNHFNYDLRVDTPSRWTADLRDYLHRDVHPVFDASAEWYLDGNYIPPYAVPSIDLNSIRYVEIRRGEGVYSQWDGTKAVNYVLVFSKIGKDAMDVKGAFKHLAIKGYDAAPDDDKDGPEGIRFNPKIKSVKYYLGRNPPFRLAVMTVVKGKIYYREETIWPE